jgi:hypothetical protein
MADDWPLVLSAACFLVAAASLLNVWSSGAVKRSVEHRASTAAVQPTFSQLYPMPIENLVDLHTRLADLVEHRACIAAMQATDAQLQAMPIEGLLDLQTRLADFVARERVQLDTSIAAAERLDRIIAAKSAPRELTRTDVVGR